MTNLEDRLKDIDFVGNIFQYLGEKRNPMEISGRTARFILENIYNDDEYYCCRLRAGIILNVFEQDLQDYLSGTGRPNWEEFYSKINQWIKELTLELASKNCGEKSVVLEDVIKFYDVVLNIQKSSYGEIDLKIVEGLGNEIINLMF